ncbi:MAG: hypothetical protein KDA99_03395, partial [Planctomycetales bacterium]|nr:hypothetical protein [Planctomycetales bacterium]
NYSSDIDLMFLYDEEGKTTGPKSLANSEYYARLCRGIVKLLTDTTEWGAAYRVDLRLRPEGKNGPIATSRVAAMHYYDVLGRTWERQALVKARPVAGDLEFGLRFLTELEPWIYRRYLTRADITGIKALKRRIEKQTLGAGTDQRNVKLGHGGIRDIEFVIQFLQLLNGGDLPELRTTNTLEAIMRLEQAGCLNMQERAILEENYALLRKIEHRLQIMLDLQTHVLPDNDRELKKVAIRAGFVDKDGSPALEQFKKTYREKTDLNRKILDHLLHDAFSDDQQTEPIVDLVLDPEPSSTSIAEVLGRYGFDDLDSAYKNLMELATECISFLSTRRCRHFLAAIAPQLLEEVSHTPAPDLTLLNLSQVSDSLGGKGVLWELFSWSSASLQLYVQLCAGSPYLSGILTSNPGMIDELMDSLVIDRLPASSWLRDSLTEMCRGAEETWQIVHGFKNSQHLRVGVRDILGKEDIRSTTAALSDIAEVCLQQVTSDEYRRLTLRHGEPRLRASAPDDPPPAWTTVSQRLLFGGDIDPLASGSGAASNSDAVGLPGDDDTCDFVILAMGKFGGREPNYHSDLDVIFLYEMEGMTGPTAKSRRADPTTNQHFFSQLGQRIIKTVNQLGPYGRLFELDARLRPTGKSGMLAVTFDEFHRYFAEGAAQLWERQSLCRARPIFGGATVRQRAMGIVRHAIVTPAWRAVDAQEIQQMRYRMEENASQHNLKRGPGGTVDIEFVVQMLQMRHGAEHPEIIVPNTLQAIDVLYNMHLMEQSDREALSRGYQTLRSVEARLRLMNTTARHDLPEDETSLAQLAYLLRRGSGQEVYDECRQLMADNRRLFKKMFREATGL